MHTSHKPTSKILNHPFTMQVFGISQTQLLGTNVSLETCHRNSATNPGSLSLTMSELPTVVLLSLLSSFDDYALGTLRGLDQMSLD